MEFNKDDTLIAKGFAIILMIMHHLYAFPKRIIGNNYYNSLFQIWGQDIEYWIGCFGKLCVCIFIFLSGFSAYKTFVKNNNSNFIFNRIFKFYKIYWTVFIIFIPLGYLLKYKREIKLFELINNITCYNITYNGEWWFATPFICIMLITPLILKYFEKDNNTVSLIKNILFIITLAVIHRTLIPNLIKFDILSEFSKSSYYRISDNILKLLPSYLMGLIFAKYEIFEKIRAKINCSYIINASISFLGLILIFDCRSKTGMAMHWDYFYAPVVIFFFTNLVRNIKHIKIIFISLGRKSSYMWLTHSFFCYQYFQKITYITRNSIIITIQLLAVSYITAIVLEKLNIFIFEKAKFLLLNLVRTNA